jgi:hypothetical protein
LQRAPSELDDVARELRGGRRLAGALQTDQRDHRRVPLEAEGPVADGEERDELVVDDLHDLLAGRQAPDDLGTHGLLADPGDEVLDHPEVDISFEQ